MACGKLPRETERERKRAKIICIDAEEVKVKVTWRGSKVIRGHAADTDMIELAVDWARLPLCSAWPQMRR